MSNILLTGINGFIGKNLYDSLMKIKKFNIYPFTTSKNTNYIYFNPKSNFSKIFINKNITNIDILILCGAYTPKNINNFENFENNYNVISTINLIESLPNKPSKVIFLSTLDVYKNTNDIIDENSEVLPDNLYSLSKFYCEKILSSWCKENNILLHILRIGHIYGTGEEKYQKLIPNTIYKLKNNLIPEIINNGIDKRSYLNIKDCTKAIISSLYLESYTGPINIVSQNAYSIEFIINNLINISGLNIKPNFIYRNINVRNLVFDNSKMRKYLHTEEVNITDGLTEEYNNFNL